MMVVVLLQLFQRLLQGVAVLDGVPELPAAQLRPGGGDDHRAGIALPQQGDGGLEPVLRDAAGAAQDDGPGVAHLVVVELPEVFDVHLCLGRVADHGGGVHFHALHPLHGADDVAELAHAAGLDQDAVGVVLLHHLMQRLGEIAHQGTADAAGVQLVHPDARLGQKAAVDADLAELVLDQHQLLALIGLGDQLLDERGLTRPQKAGKNVNFCHNSCPFHATVQQPPLPRRVCARRRTKNTSRGASVPASGRERSAAFSLQNPAKRF